MINIVKTMKSMGNRRMTKEEALKDLKVGLAKDEHGIITICAGFVTDDDSWNGRVDITKRAIEGVRDLMGWMLREQQKEDPNQKSLDIDWDVGDRRHVKLIFTIEDVEQVNKF